MIQDISPCRLDNAYRETVDIVHGCGQFFMPHVCPQPGGSPKQYDPLITLSHRRLCRLPAAMDAAALMTNSRESFMEALSSEGIPFS